MAQLRVVMRAAAYSAVLVTSLMAASLAQRAIDVLLTTAAALDDVCGTLAEIGCMAQTRRVAAECDLLRRGVELLSWLLVVGCGAAALLDCISAGADAGAGADEAGAGVGAYRALT